MPIARFLRIVWRGVRASSCDHDVIFHAVSVRSSAYIPVRIHDVCRQGIVEAAEGWETRLVMKHSVAQFCSRPE